MKSALSQHQEQNGQRNTNTPLEEKIKVLAKEPRDPHRKITEAIHINLRQASMNRTDGYDMPDIYLPLLREAEAGRGDRH